MRSVSYSDEVDIHCRARPGPAESTGHSRSPWLMFKPPYSIPSFNDVTMAAHHNSVLNTSRSCSKHQHQLRGEAASRIHPDHPIHRHTSPSTWRTPSARHGAGETPTPPFPPCPSCSNSTSVRTPSFPHVREIFPQRSAIHDLMGPVLGHFAEVHLRILASAAVIVKVVIVDNQNPCRTSTRPRRDLRRTPRDQATLRRATRRTRMRTRNSLSGRKFTSSRCSIRTDRSDTSSLRRDSVLWTRRCRLRRRHKACSRRIPRVCERVSRR